MKTTSYRYSFPLLIAVICAIGLVVTFSLGAGRGHAEPKQAKPKATVAGSEMCVECHTEAHEQLTQSPHGLAILAAEKAGRSHACESCHGPGSLHVEDPSKETAAPLKAQARSGEGCFACHDTVLSHADWRRADHHRAGINCLACHGEARTLQSPPAVVKDVKAGAKDAQTAKSAKPAPFTHAAFTRKPSSDACLSCHAAKTAEFALPTHHPVKEGRIGCDDCHNPHTPMTEREKREVCVTCHAKQRGPHVYEHGAISGRLTDGCLDCHRPHGSPNADLLKLTGRGLCLQCHADRATHFTGRNCQSCHRAVHGSNTSPGLFRE